MVPKLGWHFTFWIMFMFSGLVVTSNFFLVPETVSTLSLSRIGDNHTSSSVHPRLVTP
jgi:predicted MFS family arabinose efflux permease